jgi:hypothetical protein
MTEGKLNVKLLSEEDQSTEGKGFTFRIQNGLGNSRRLYFFLICRNGTGSSQEQHSCLHQ